jgi:lysophospholipase L1-like esterase
VFAALLWTAVVAGETYLRYVHDATDQWGATLTNISWHRRHLRLNAQGFRDREFAGLKRSGAPRVACVGDSFTMGWGVDEAQDCWPQRLGALLEERAPGRFETLNLGMMGHGTGEEARLVDDLVARRLAERVVLAYCLNDADDLLPPDRQFTAKKLPRPTWVEPHSFVADYFWFRLRLFDDPYLRDADLRQADAYRDEAVWAKQRERFARIAQTCAAARLPLTVVVFPFFSDWGAEYRFDECHEKTAAAWRDLGVPVVDLREACRDIPRGELVVNRFDGHPSARAHDLAARAILTRAFGL